MESGLRIWHYYVILASKYDTSRSTEADFWAFEIMLELFWKQFENVIQCHFPSCELLHKNGSVRVSFPTAEMINSLAENFEMTSTHRLS
jgi:hypothetical protein